MYFLYFCAHKSKKNRITIKTMDNKAMLLDNFKYYLENQEELLKKYTGKYLVIVNKEVVGDYDDQLVAMIDASQKYGEGNFFLQLCTPGDEAYTQIFHTRRVSFTA